MMEGLIKKNQKLGVVESQVLERVSFGSQLCMMQKTEKDEEKDQFREWKEGEMECE